jgi:hypothetical protein
MDIWPILRPINSFFAIVILYFMVIWYMYFPPFWYVAARKIWQPCLKFRIGVVGKKKHFSRTLNVSKNMSPVNAFVSLLIHACNARQVNIHNCAAALPSKNLTPWRDSNPDLPLLRRKR